MSIEITEWFKVHFGTRQKALFDFDASRPDQPVVEIYTAHDGALLNPQEAEELGNTLLAWAQRYGRVES